MVHTLLHTVASASRRGADQAQRVEVATPPCSAAACQLAPPTGVDSRALSSIRDRGKSNVKTPHSSSTCARCNVDVCPAIVPLQRTPSCVCAHTHTCVSSSVAAFPLQEPSIAIQRCLARSNHKEVYCKEAITAWKNCVEKARELEQQTSSKQ